MQRLQLLAHGRGTSLLLTALRELAIQSISAGYERAERLKIDNVVLMSPAAPAYLEQWGNIDLVVYEGKRTDFFDHAYFLSNPEVSSDLVQLIRYGRAPGESGRKLEPMGTGVWRFRPPDVAESAHSPAIR